MVRISRIWKLYLIYTILLVAGMTLAGFVLEDRLKGKLFEHLEEDVTTLGAVLAKIVPDTEDPTEILGFCETFAKLAGVRLTVLRSEDGKVLGDSEEGEIIGQSRIDRPEVQHALKQERAIAVRYSETVEADMLYTALFLKEKKKIIRLGMPMSKIKIFQNQVMILFSLALFLAPVIAMIISFFLAKYKIYQGDKYATGAWPRHL
jgi:two-component system, OmpR family, phosphate regulon sensor histidine kinase PhoR